jgi:hypothetical protein
MNLKAYGRGKVISKDGLFQLTEVSLVGTPDELKSLAKFLEEAAATKERVGEGFGHRHLRDEKALHPWDDHCADVIVA